MKPMPWTPVLVAATVVLCSMWVLAQGPAGQPHVTHAATVQFVALPSAPDTMPYYALFYDVVNDFVARRTGWLSAGRSGPGLWLLETSSP